MPNILVVQSSPKDEHSHSRALVHHYVAAWSAANPEGTVTPREAAGQAIPHLDGPLVQAFFTPPDDLSPEQRERTSLSDALIDEFEAADELVFGVAMHNFGVPSSLKAYVDHIVRVGRTFRYTEAGVEGLVRDRKVTVVVASGNRYDQHPFAAFNHADTWLTTILGFLGVRSVAVIRAGGLALGDEARDGALAAAKQALEARVAH